MNSNIKVENGKLMNNTEVIVNLKEMEKDIIKLQYEKVGWVSVLALLSFIVVLFNIFVIGQLNSFRTELNSFEASINHRFDKLELAIAESNRRSDILFQELINLKTK